MIYLYLTVHKVIVFRVGRVWLYAPLDVGGVLAMLVYSILRVSTRPCFGLSVQSRLNPLLTLFGPGPTLSISLSLRVNHHTSAKLTTSTPMKVSMSIITHTIYSVARIFVECLAIFPVATGTADRARVPVSVVFVPISRFFL